MLVSGTAINNSFLKLSFNQQGQNGLVLLFFCEGWGMGQDGTEAKKH